MKPFTALLISTLLGFFVDASADAPRLLVNNDEINRVAATKLNPGYQGTVTISPTMLDAGLGPSPFFLFEVPSLGHPYELVFVSSVVNAKIFYPIFVLLDSSKHPIQELRLPMDPINQPNDKIQATFRIPVSVGVRYLAVTTDPSLFGKGIEHTKTSSATLPVYTGSTMIYVPGPTTTQRVQLTISDDPHMVVRVPETDEYSAMRAQAGVFANIGVMFGGERVANNPTGDAYNAGSGAVFELGYAHTIAAQNAWLWRVGGGPRYQGGQGSSEGLIFNGAVVRAFALGDFLGNIGAGVYGDMLNKVSSADGKSTEFKDAAGPMAFIEWRAADQFNFGLRFASINYESTKGVSYSGNQGGLYLGLWF